MAKAPQNEFFETLAEIAEFLDMPLDALLRQRNAGTFPIEPRPRDATPVYFKADVEAWDRANRPYGKGWQKALMGGGK